MSVYEPFQSNSRRVLCLLALCCLSAKGLLAAEPSDFNGTLQIHGFFTQGYVKTTENSFFGDSKDGSFDFNEIGINTSYRVSPTMMASAQLLSRTAGEMYDGSLDVDFAQFDYAHQLDETSQIGFIVGRNKNPFGFYNDTRDVAATRPGIFMPQAIYWDRVRNMVLSNDGGQLYAKSQFGNHLFNLQLIAGKTPIDENVEKSYLNPGLSPKLEQDGVTTGGRLLYEWDGGRIRLALSNASLTMNGEMNSFPPGGFDMDYWVVSSQYNDGPLSLTMEYMKEPIDYTGFGGLMDVGDTTVEGYYLQGSYRVQPDWEMFARYEESYYDKRDKDGSKIGAKLGLPPYNFYSKLWTVGLLWEPTGQLMLRSEFSQVEGTIFLSNLENPLPDTSQRDWNLFSLLVSYSF